MIKMKSLKHGATALLLIAAFLTVGVYEAAAVPALYGTFGKGEYSSSTLVEIDQNTGEILRFIGQVGFSLNGLAWDTTTGRLYGSARESNQKYITSGSHNGGNASAVLVDSSRNFISLGVAAGMQVLNQTDGSWGTITSVSVTTITASLTGGTDNLWDNGDNYRVNDVTFNGLVLIDPATGEGTAIGVQGWGLGDSTPITNITVNSSGQMYGWTENGDDLVRINKSTGIATVIGNSGVSTYANGLAFDKYDTLYLVNGDGNYYIINTTTGSASLQGDISPGAEEPAHHGVFHPYTNRYYGLRNNPWPWDTSSTNLLSFNLSSGSLLSMAPTAFDLHTLAFVDVPGLLYLDLGYDDADNELTMQFTVGTEVPVTLIVWLHVFHLNYYLVAVPIPVVDPRTTVDATIPFPANLGNVGILATLVTPDNGITYSAWETVDTGN